MCGLIRMKAQDLLELYQLLGMYRQTYGESDEKSLEGWMGQIGEEYREATKGGNICTGSNPRKAGRKRVYTEEQDRQIMALHRSGASLRTTAQEAGCSLGHVQDVIKRGKIE